MSKIVLTKQIIEQGRSSKGGWSNQQWFCLGITSEEMKVGGWKDNIMDKEFDKELIDRFLALKDAHFDNNKSCDQLSLPLS